MKFDVDIPGLQRMDPKKICDLKNGSMGKM